MIGVLAPCCANLTAHPHTSTTGPIKVCAQQIHWSYLSTTVQRKEWTVLSLFQAMCVLHDSQQQQKTNFPTALIQSSRGLCLYIVDIHIITLLVLNTSLPNNWAEQSVCTSHNKAKGVLYMCTHWWLGSLLPAVQTWQPPPPTPNP